LTGMLHKVEDYFDVASSSWIGCRPVQEDSFLTRYYPDEEKLLAIVSDGMGGHAAGEVASNLAIQSFVSRFESVSDVSEPPERLRDALFRANQSIFDHTAKNQAHEGMGCTFSAIALSKDHISWVSVGDSGIYLWDTKSLKRLNEDHSIRGLVKSYLSLGKITPEEADSYPNKGALRSALTGDNIDLIDLSSRKIDLKTDEALILATDGIEVLTPQEIEKTLIDQQAKTAAAILERLIREVKLRNVKNQDNLSVIVIKRKRVNLSSNSSNSKWKVHSGGRLFLVISLLVGLGLIIATLGVIFLNKLNRPSLFNKSSNINIDVLISDKFFRNI